MVSRHMANDNEHAGTTAKTDEPSTPLQPGRRKVVDRRDPDSQGHGISNERRQDQERRGKRPQTKEARSGKKTSTSSEAEKKALRLQQHRRKVLLAGCEPVMGLNYDVLAMDDYPSNEAVAKARKDRDFWLANFCLFSSGFLFGFTHLVPAWIAGISCGLAVLCFALAYTPIRQILFTSPPLKVLLQQRKALEFSALNHIQFLEGQSGLAWRCEKLGKYNANLNRKLFRGLVAFSHDKILVKVIRNRKQIRLYLLFLIEAQKAYKRLQKDYLELHFSHLEHGWDDALSETEAQHLEKTMADEQASPGAAA